MPPLADAGVVSPDGVIYRLEPDEILIVAVAHLHQEPRRWDDRT